MFSPLLRLTGAWHNPYQPSIGVGDVCIFYFFSPALNTHSRKRLTSPHGAPRRYRTTEPKNLFRVTTWGDRHAPRRPNSGVSVCALKVRLKKKNVPMRALAGALACSPPTRATLHFAATPPTRCAFAATTTRAQVIAAIATIRCVHGRRN